MKEFRVNMSQFGRMVNFGTTITAASIDKARAKAIKLYGKKYPHVLHIWERS